jgi:electron transfer flavoprotein alpha subunit
MTTNLRNVPEGGKLIWNGKIYTKRGRNKIGWLRIFNAEEEHFLPYLDMVEKIEDDEILLSDKILLRDEILLSDENLSENTAENQEKDVVATTPQDDYNGVGPAGKAVGVPILEESATAEEADPTRKADITQFPEAQAMKTLVEVVTGEDVTVKEVKKPRKRRRRRRTKEQMAADKAKDDKLDITVEKIKPDKDAGKKFSKIFEDKHKGRDIIWEADGSVSYGKDSGSGETIQDEES